MLAAHPVSPRLSSFALHITPLPSRHPLFARIAYPFSSHHSSSLLLRVSSLSFPLFSMLGLSPRLCFMPPSPLPSPSPPNSPISPLCSHCTPLTSPLRSLLTSLSSLRSPLSSPLPLPCLLCPPPLPSPPSPRLSSHLSPSRPSSLPSHRSSFIAPAPPLYPLLATLCSPRSSLLGRDGQV